MDYNHLNFHFQEEENLQDILHWNFSPPRESIDLFNISFTPKPLLQTPLSESYRSAFVDYKAFNVHSMRLNVGYGQNVAPSIHQRMIKFLRRTMMTSKYEESIRMPIEDSREFRHMMRERQRREKLSQSYADLYAALDTKSKKGDKISIVQSAREYLSELKQVRYDLQQRNKELKVMTDKIEHNSETMKINLHVKNSSKWSSMSIESTIAALQCLKQMEVKVTSVKTHFSDKVLAIEAGIETKASVEEVEKAMKAALDKIEDQ